MDAGDASRPNTVKEDSVSPPSPNRLAKRSEDLRVFNRSRSGFLSLKVAIFDSTTEPLKRLFEYLVREAETGLWLKPYRGIPTTPGAKFFDLVYLDEECKVMHDVDHYPNPQFTVLADEPASALLFPAHTVFASHIRPGDQLAIRDSDELEGMLESLSNSNGLGSSDQAAGALREKPAVGNLASDANSGPHRILEQAESKRLNAAKREFDSEKKTSSVVRAWRWFFPKIETGHRSNRVPLPGLIAYHWSGGTPQAYLLGNISKTGFYLITPERPYPGTLILMTLQRTGRDGEKLGNSIAVYAQVIRWGPDGVGFAFVAVEGKDAKTAEIKSIRAADQESLTAFLKPLNLP
jgi:hypothetical protein